MCIAAVFVTSGHLEHVTTSLHLNEVGTYCTKLISNEPSVLIQQLKLRKDTALSLFCSASDGESSAGQTIILPLAPVQLRKKLKTNCYRLPLQPPAWIELHDGVGWSGCWSRTPSLSQMNLKTLERRFHCHGGRAAGWNRNQGGMWTSLTAPTWANRPV